MDALMPLMPEIADAATPDTPAAPPLTAMNAAAPAASSGAISLAAEATPLMVGIAFSSPEFAVSNAPLMPPLRSLNPPAIASLPMVSSMDAMPRVTAFEQFAMAVDTPPAAVSACS